MLRMERKNFQRLHFVDHTAQQLHTGLVQLFNGILYDRQRGGIVTHNEQRMVCQFVQAQHIRGTSHRGSINDDILVGLHDRSQKVEQGGIQRHRIGFQHHRQKVQIAGQRNNRFRLGRFAFVQGIQRPAVRQILQKHSAQAGSTGVQIQQQGALFHIGQLQGQIGRHRALAFSILSRSHIEPVRLCRGAESVDQDMRGRSKVLHGIGICTVRFAQQLHVLLEVAVVLGDAAQRFELQDVLHVLHIQQGGPQEKLQHRQTRTGGQTQHTEDHPQADILAGTAARCRSCFRSIDHGHRAHHQRFRQDLLDGIHQRIHQLDAGLGIVPGQSKQQHLRLIVAAHLQILRNILCRDRYKARTINGSLQGALALHHKGRGVHHIQGLIKGV